MINTFWKHSPRSQIILYKPKRLLFKFFYVSSFEMMLNSKCQKSPFRCGFKLQQVVRTTAIHMTVLMQVYWHCGSTVYPKIVATCRFYAKSIVKTTENKKKNNYKMNNHVVFACCTNQGHSLSLLICKSYPVLYQTLKILHRAIEMWPQP